MRIDFDNAYSTFLLYVLSLLTLRSRNIENAFSIKNLNEISQNMWEKNANTCGSTQYFDVCVVTKGMKKVSTSLFAMIVLFAALAQPFDADAQRRGKKKTSRPAPAKKEVYATQHATQWVDSVMATLSLEEKIGQLMIVRVPTKMKPKDEKAFNKLITDYHVGGVCFFAGTAVEQLKQTKQYQRMSKVPLFISIDGEWGLGMRLTDCYSFPRQMMMGALSPANDTLITLMGNEIGRQCHNMGININFAPVVDLNSNPLNPVIGARSFGAKKNRVASKGIRYAQALQSQHVMAVAKHFPGHGDTETDSHVDVPVINHTKAYVDSVDTYPFKRLIAAGCRGIMVGHLQVNAYDTKNIATLSEPIMNELLREKMRFTGLIITDGMDMKAVTKNHGKAESTLLSLQAGSDVLLLPLDVEGSVELIKAHAEEDYNFAQLIDNKCRRVLYEKYRFQLHKLDLDALSVPTKKDRERCEEITAQIAEKALTLVRNDRSVLPLKKSDNVAWIALGNADSAVTTLSGENIGKVASADKVVITLAAYANPTAQNNYGVSSKMVDLISQITAFNHNTVLVIYGSPFILQYFPFAKTSTQGSQRRSTPADSIIYAGSSLSTTPAAIVVAYQDMAVVHKAVDKQLRAGKFEGQLPVDIDHFMAPKSLTSPKKTISPYAQLVKAGMDTLCFHRIDSIINGGIQAQAYPGCQLLVAYKGQVVYQRCYGRQTYDANSPKVDTNTVYDLASLTKVTATTFAIMKLVDAGKIKLDDPLSRYLPYLKHTNKSKITIRETLSHIARLKSFDAYWKNASECMDASLPNCQPTEQQLTKTRLSLLTQIAASPLNKDKHKYVYSDLGFILLADVVERVSGQTLDLFMQQQFYGPMGMTSTTFQPLLGKYVKIDEKRIAPTETNPDIRQRTLRGEVHDPNAAAFGGVAGHAGLFSTAADLNKLYQMMLAGGSYGGKQYLSTDVINTFNQRYYTQYNNRRALGYDKPFIKGNSTHVSPLATQSSYGHTGFTGTMVWVDPDRELVYIFLSNRVYPSATPNKLANMNIRTDVQTLIYQSLPKKKK